MEFIGQLKKHYIEAKDMNSNRLLSHCLTLFYRHVMIRKCLLRGYILGVPTHTLTLQATILLNRIN